MKLYVKNNDDKKVYLDIKAVSKRELSEKLGGFQFLINGEQFFINQVAAEKSSNATPVSMVLGGALGIVGGVPGVLLGGLLGGLFGKDADDKENAQIMSFNEEQF